MDLALGCLSEQPALPQTVPHALPPSLVQCSESFLSLVWALYKFKPGLIRAGVGAPTGAGVPAAVDQTQANQETPLLPLPTVHNGTSASGDATAAASVQIQTTDVDLANYFSPMTTTTNQGIQADLNSGGSGAGWIVSSALATHSSIEEVSKSHIGGPSGGGTSTMNVGTQTAANLQADMTGQGAATGTAVYSTYLYDSRTVSDTTRDTIQVRKASASS